MSFQQFLLVIRARWRVVFGIFGGVVFLAVAVSLQMQKQYTATASVVATAKADPVAGMVEPELLLGGYIATQVDIISSERVARRVVKALKLDQSPEVEQDWHDSTGGRGDVTSWLAGRLLKVLVVAPSRESNVINITFKWPDPKAAAALANAFAQAYIDTNIELQVDPARQYASWFDERSRALRADFEAKQKRLSDYQSQTGIVATDERLDIENARLNELSSELVTIQAQRQDSQSRQRQVSGDNESMPEVLQSSLISGLKGSLSASEAKLQDIATNLGKNHPDYKTTEAEIASLRDRIAQETAKIVASLGSTTQVNVRRESDIAAALAAQKKRVLELKQQHDQAADLQNDVLAAQRNLDAVTLRQAQSSLESQMQQTSAVLLTSAVEPLRHSSPSLLLNTAVGIILGTFLGLGTAVFLEVLNPRIRSDQELAQVLGVPLLGNIASKNTGKRARRWARRWPPPWPWRQVALRSQ
jgi:chain length determinant protein EpsF